MKPIIPLVADYPEWHRPVAVPNNRVFGVLTICHWCLRRIAPQSRWSNRLRGLFGEFAHIPLTTMGFPPNWESCPIWSESEEPTHG